jgi:hypothetical protein
MTDNFDNTMTTKLSKLPSTLVTRPQAHPEDQWHAQALYPLGRTLHRY